MRPCQNDITGMPSETDWKKMQTTKYKSLKGEQIKPIPKDLNTACSPEPQVYPRQRAVVGNQLQY
jgi:hypothetical protein